MAAAFDFESPVVLDGPRLHREVPPERWCVTRQDLLEFLRLVRKRAAACRITPTASDGFDADEDVIGPRIYTVNEQLIRPVTAKAGNVSWALMLHPHGLRCDLFVTHCWAEGIYEFVLKVLHSWPYAAHHAYCCMLSNPQNLDISGLIRSPRDSPFAHALLASPCMLVVPNHTTSIYSRIWCAYEAFLAYSESKVIVTASAPTPRVKRNVARISSVATIVFCASIAALLWLGTSAGLNHKLRMFVLAGTCFFLFLTPMIHDSPIARVSTVASAGLSGLGLALSVLLIVKPTNPIELCTPILMALAAFLMSVSAVLAEVDYVNRRQARKEAAQLRKDYTGTLHDAQSTVPEDGERIMAELESSGLAQDVDAAIQVLLDSGISSASLRVAVARAGSLANVGYWNVSVVTWCWGSWLLLMLAYIGPRVEMYKFHTGHGHCMSSISEDPGSQEACAELDLFCRSPLEDLDMYISVVGLLEALGWLVLFAALHQDKRGFAAGALVRFQGRGMALIFLALLLHSDGCADLAERAWAPRLVALGLAPATLLMAALGPGALSRIPLVGPPLLRHLMNPVTPGHFRCCRPRSSRKGVGEPSSSEAGPAVRSSDAVGDPCSSDTGTDFNI